jgi:hypothetical protein
MPRGRQKAAVVAREPLQRISVERCRELLGEAALGLNDDQITTLRDAYYVTALALCRQFLHEHGTKKSGNQHLDKDPCIPAVAA